MMAVGARGVISVASNLILKSVMAALALQGISPMRAIHCYTRFPGSSWKATDSAKLHWPKWQIREEYRPPLCPIMGQPEKAVRDHAKVESYPAVPKSTTCSLSCMSKGPDFELIDSRRKASESMAPFPCGTGYRGRRPLFLPKTALRPALDPVAGKSASRENWRRFRLSATAATSQRAARRITMSFTYEDV